MEPTPPLADAGKGPANKRKKPDTPDSDETPAPHNAAAAGGGSSSGGLRAPSGAELDHSGAPPPAGADSSVVPEAPKDAEARSSDGGIFDSDSEESVGARSAGAGGAEDQDCSVVQVVRRRGSEVSFIFSGSNRAYFAHEHRRYYPISHVPREDEEEDGTPHEFHTELMDRLPGGFQTLGRAYQDELGDPDILRM